MNRIIGLMALAAGLSWAQTTGRVDVSWKDLVNPPGRTFIVERADSACAGTPTFVQKATGITATNWTDPAVPGGTYCYRVKAVYGGLTSDPSNTAAAVIATTKPVPPTEATVTVTVTIVVVIP